VEIKKETLTLERFALAAVVGLLSWNVYTTNQLTISQAVLTSQLTSIREELGASGTKYASQGEYLVLRAEVDGMEQRFANWLARTSDRLNEVERLVDRNTEGRTNESELQ
jgi:hypothetical protein